MLAGLAKLLRAKPIAEQFEEFALDPRAMIVVGGLEVLGGIGLLISSLTLYAAVGLALLMLGAVANHLKVKHPTSKLAPSAVLLILTSLYIYFIG